VFVNSLAFGAFLTLLRTTELGFFASSVALKRGVGHPGSKSESCGSLVVWGSISALWAPVVRPQLQGRRYAKSHGLPKRSAAVMSFGLLAARHENLTIAASVLALAVSLFSLG
jgi:hypothetical protein